MSKKSEELLRFLAGEEKAAEESEETTVNLPEQTPKDMVIAHQKAKLDRLMPLVKNYWNILLVSEIFLYLCKIFDDYN